MASRQEETASMAHASANYIAVPIRYVAASETLSAEQASSQIINMLLSLRTCTSIHSSVSFYHCRRVIFQS